MTRHKQLLDFAEMAVRCGKAVHATGTQLAQCATRIAKRISLGQSWQQVSWFGWLILLLSWTPSSSAVGQLVDSLDAYPPRWSLLSSDCEARVVEQTHHNDALAEGGRCEAITFSAQNGTEAIFLYPIEPVRAIDELTARLRLKGLQKGLRIGFRVRFPYVIDPETRRPASVFIYGSDYRRAGEFQTLGVGAIDRPLKLKRVVVRKQYGFNADVSTPYVDAVVLDAYGGPGQSTIRLDDLHVDAMVALANSSSSAAAARTPRTTRAPLTNQMVAQSELTNRRGTSSMAKVSPQLGNLPDVNGLPAVNGLPDVSGLSALHRMPFPLGRVTRILQHQGEPLGWIRSLGFDAVWLPEPPNAAILSEAIQARMRILAPAPSSPQPDLQPLLEPVLAWVVASDLAMDAKNESAIEQRVKRVRELPIQWQRPLVGAPVENYRDYGSILDAAVLDVAPRVRNLSSQESRASRNSQSRRLGSLPLIVGISGNPNSVAVTQADAIAQRIGTPTCESFAWQSMWRQVADAIADCPEAILFRSSSSLAEGTLLQQNRAMAMSYVNRFVAMLEPWVAGGTVDPQPLIVRDSADGTPIYAGHRIVHGPTTLLILTSSMTRGENLLAGDGKTLTIDIPSMDEGRLIWRLTHFSAERMSPQVSASGSKLEIISPDVAEVIAISSELSEGGKLADSAQRYAQQASLDRWQLVGDAITRNEIAWQRADALRLLDRRAPFDLLSVAKTTLEEAGTLVRARQGDAGLRLARRADAWTLKSRWMLHEALSKTPGNDYSRRIISSPPMLADNLETQIAWSPLLWTPSDRSTPAAQAYLSGKPTPSRWGTNRLPGGDFERAGALGREGWTLGSRHAGWADSEAVRIHRGAFAGEAALSVRVTPRTQIDARTNTSTNGDSLPGGYEGTCLFVRSPPIRIPAGSAVRIDAVVRTLGFQGPHQGLLFYDSVGQQELGVLVRDLPDWTPVTLYRQTIDDEPLHVMFEVLGGGEATIDSIEVRVWEPPSAAR